jgi:hypothetical protein
MANATEFFTGSLKAADLEEDKPLTLTIRAAVPREYDGQRKLTLNFEGIGQHLVLNQTNLSAITELYGKETADWIGKELTLVRDMTTFGRKKVACIRVAT